MAKRKINAAMILAAGEDAHLQTNDTKVSHAKQIDGQEFLEIEINKIINNPMQPRISINNQELQDLMSSIKEHGLIQPIAVIRTREGKFILKAGQRRWLAHKELGLEKIKAIVEDATNLSQEEEEKKLFEVAIMENTHRDNLDPLELALSLKQAMDKNFYTNLEELSQALSKSKSYISKVFKVLSLEEEIIKDLENNKSTNDIESLYEIQKIKDSQEQVRVYFDFVAKKLDRKALRSHNKTKILHAKQEVFFITKPKFIKLDLDTTKLTESQKKNMIEELENVLKKYF